MRNANSNNIIENDQHNNNNSHNSVHEIVELMANMINYLNVSLYEGLFTYNHEQARAELNSIYQSVTLKSNQPPCLDDTINFYRNVIYLKSVTDTDDATYYTYIRQLKSYLQTFKDLSSSSSS
jgi:hypothetical protein